ncbi:integrase/recombinase XerD [Thalassobacillus cyri]|uniref:Integrase/recombinase XerD n=1 Tax=Thalassobacillus cyri TaxID=571932 RepID=A0A1H4GW87_9BACI|nr:tyrosine-type recombinase/integrase [Thalassobacillus cyri]SEB13794.1 integrase/recombinase XerD [Thalassobacillus cyri]
MDNNFMVGIKTPKTDAKLPGYMKMEEVRQLFAFLERDSHPLALRNQTMLKLLATTGMRRKELVDLTWEQLNFY